MAKRIDPADRYDKLRGLGVDRRKAAVMANSHPAPPRPGDVDDWTRDELERFAAERGIDRPAELSDTELRRVVCAPPR